MWCHGCHWMYCIVGIFWGRKLSWILWFLNIRKSSGFILEAWQIAHVSSLACVQRAEVHLAPERPGLCTSTSSLPPHYQSLMDCFRSLCLCVALFAHNFVSELCALLLLQVWRSVETMPTHACSVWWAQHESFLHEIVFYVNSRKFSPSKDSRSTVLNYYVSRFMPLSACE